MKRRMFTQSQGENMRIGNTVRCRCYLFLVALLLPLLDDHQVLMVHGLARPIAVAATVVAVVTNRRAALFSAAGIVTAVAVVGQVQQESLVPPLTPLAALAYERRDVGDETRSAESAAYNLQAYETNNRLERQGMKLETQAEQKASLTAALAEYSYAPTTTTTTTNKTDGRGSSGSMKSSRSSTSSD